MGKMEKTDSGKDMTGEKYNGNEGEALEIYAGIHMKKWHPSAKIQTGELEDR